MLIARRCVGTAGTPTMSTFTRRSANCRNRRAFRHDLPERHIRRAVELRDASEYEAAIFEFSRAVEAGGALAETAQREAARDPCVVWPRLVSSGRHRRRRDELGSGPGRKIRL